MSSAREQLEDAGYTIAKAGDYYFVSKDGEPTVQVQELEHHPKYDGDPEPEQAIKEVEPLTGQSLGWAGYVPPDTSGPNTAV